jgi:peptidoglycan/LPS O-acetylase OafA/YrhL
LLAVLALLVGMAAMFHFVIGLSLFSMTWNIGIIRIVPEFLLGIALYQLGTRYSLGPQWALAGTLACIVGPIALAYSGAPHAAIVLLLAALIWFVADAERHGRMAVICGRFPVLLGEVSYSVYMLHFGIGIALFGGLPDDVLAASSLVALLQIAGGLAVVTFIAWILHIVFELPVRSWINRHAGRIMQPVDNRP